MAAAFISLAAGSPPPNIPHLTRALQLPYRTLDSFGEIFIYSSDDRWRPSQPLGFVSRCVIFSSDDPALRTIRQPVRPQSSCPVFFFFRMQTDPLAGVVSHFHCNSTFVLFSGRKSLYCCLRYGASVTLRQDGAERNPHCVHLRSSVSGSGELQPLHRQQIPCTRHLYPPPIDQIIEYLLCIPPGPL